MRRKATVSIAAAVVMIMTANNLFQRIGSSKMAHGIIKKMARMLQMNGNRSMESGIFLTRQEKCAQVGWKRTENGIIWIPPMEI